MGNPGAEYEATRHNAGFLAVDALAAAWGSTRFRRPWRWRARVAETEVAGEPVLLVKPQTYMNRSGAALGPLLDRGINPATELLVIVDELALPLGSLRLRPSGSAGGHNGLRSVASRLGSEQYARLRVGIGPRPEDEDGADYVLDPFTAEERATLDTVLPEIVGAVECWITDGIETAMNRYNRTRTQSD